MAPVLGKSAWSATAKKAAKRKGGGSVNRNKANPKAVLSPQDIAKRKQLRAARNLFGRLGFVRVKSDGKTIKFDGRTGELDDIYVSENIMLLVEYTVGKETAAHVSKKSILYSKIRGAPTAWIGYAVTQYADFQALFDQSGYLESDYRVAVCYISTEGVSDEVSEAFDYINFLDGTTFRYFDALAKAIHRTARFEFFKYLGLRFTEIGDQVKKTSTARTGFEGHVLPETFSSFPKDFKIVSFYADPATLLKMSYVFRRDSWRDEEAMYQRVLQKGRMNQMRKYLTSEKRVFVNNIIVTLPDDTVLNEIGGSGKNIDPKSISGVVAANITVPSRSNTIGIVDGQHRVFCYHEGNDKLEPQIRAIRDRQNLLVTGIIFPPGFSDLQKRRFEAKLFLEINDKQKRTGSELKQSIELILNPFSTISIAKSVIQRLNSSGALKGMLQTNYFDSPGLLKTTSIVSYGLRPLLKLDGSDSLFSAWTDKEKMKMVTMQAGGQVEGADRILKDYVDFCVESINALLNAAKKCDTSLWRLPENKKEKKLSPTVVNGFIVCLRQLVRHGKLGSSSSYEAKLSGLPTFKFDKYKSSAWKALGDDLFSTYFK
ncbi:MAG: DGQHR domain-containing protein [Xanthomonadales bacterium]|nr:DGQHR domain-containing protein [Xanthomonadales bacterium]